MMEFCEVCVCMCALYPFRGHHFFYPNRVCVFLCFSLHRDLLTYYVTGVHVASGAVSTLGDATGWVQVHAALKKGQAFGKVNFPPV